jgi:hypothetical protein
LSRLHALSTAALLAVLVASPSAVLAQAIPLDGDVPTRVVGVPNAPVALSACKLHLTLGPGVQGNVVVTNRTTHALSAARIVLVEYDVENTRMDQQNLPLALADPVVPGDSASGNVVAGFRGDSRLLSRVTCRVQSAEFSANKKWTYGQTWHEKLVPLPTEQASYGGGKETAPRRVAAAPHVQVAVTKTWTDTLDGVLYVHDALAIVGSEGTVTLHPSDLTLTVPLANGARKTYIGLAQAAPTYQRLNPFGSSTTTVPEVAPAEDFGRIGMMTVPPHGSVTTTVTFAIADPVAPDATYREVSLR